jgi:hypothetical protein
LFLAIAILFIDNIKVKGLYINYSKELKLLKICRFVFEYLQNLNKALKQIKRAKAFIKLKSQFYYNNISIISFVYSFKGKSLITIKVNKVLN